jgi:hypothetical protein
MDVRCEFAARLRALYPARMRTSLTALASIGLALSACASAPEPAPAVPAAPTPPAEAAAPAKPAAPIAPMLSVFAEGFGLDVGTIGGEAVLYDDLFDGWATIAGDEVKLVQGAYAGLETGKFARLRALGGSASRPAAYVRRAGGSEVVAREGSAWKTAAPLGVDYYTPLTLLPGARDEVVAVVLSSEAPAAVVRAPAGQLVEWRRGTTQALPATFRGLAATTTATGEVILVGALRDPGSNAPGRTAVARVAPGSTEATIAPLPPPAGAPPSGPPDAAICDRDGVGTFVVELTDVAENARQARALVLRDGAWAVASKAPTPEIPGRAPGQAVGCAVARDGALWFAAATRSASSPWESSVFRMGPDGAWARVDLPPLPPLAAAPQLRTGPDAKAKGTMEIGEQRLASGARFLARRVVATAAGDVYLTGVRMAGHDVVAFSNGVEFERDQIVLRAGPPREGGPLAWSSLAGDVVPRLAREPYETPAPAPTKKPAKDAPVKRGLLPPSKPDCSRNFVALEDVAPGTPDGAAFPEIAAALASKPALGLATFLVADLGDRKVVGARAPSYPFAKALAEHVRQSIPGTKPAIYCGDAASLRVLPMEAHVTSKRALSSMPTTEEWDAAKECVVRGSSAAKCETKRVRDWVRVVCRGKNDGGGTIEGVSLTSGAEPGEVFTFGSKGYASLVYPFVAGTDVTATFRFSDRPRTLRSTWPAGAPSPDVVGELK